MIPLEISFKVDAYEFKWETKIEMKND